MHPFPRLGKADANALYYIGIWLDLEADEGREPVL